MKLSCLWEVWYSFQMFYSSETVPSILLQYPSGKTGIPSFSNRKYIGNTSIPSNARISPIIFLFFNAPPHISLGKSSEHSHLSQPSNHPPCPTRNAVGISAEKSSGTIHATPWARRPQRKLSARRFHPPLLERFQRGAGPNKYPLKYMCIYIYKVHYSCFCG